MELTTLILSTAVILGSTVCMAQQKQLPVQVTVENAPNVYKPETIAVRKAIRIHNQHGFFSVRALLTKPNAKLQQERKLQLDCGNYGFSAHVNFLTLTVNGITDRKLQLKAEDMVAWQEGDKKRRFSPVQFRWCKAPSVLLHAPRFSHDLVPHCSGKKRDSV